MLNEKMQKQSSLLKSGYVLLMVSYLVLVSTFFFTNTAGLATIASTLMGVIHLLGIILIWFAKRKATGEDLKHCAYVLRSFWIYNLAALVFLGIALWSAFQIIQIGIDPTTEALTYNFVENNLMTALTIAGNLGVVVLTIWYFWRTAYASYCFFAQKELKYTIKEPTSWKELVKARLLKKADSTAIKAANDD